MMEQEDAHQSSRPKPIRVLVAGAAGRMGQEVVKAVSATDGMELVALVDTGLAAAERGYEESIEKAIAIVKPDKIDVMVDFTHPDAVMDNVTTALNAGVHCVVGTTGLSVGDLSTISAMCKHNGVNCFVAPNFAIGAVLMMQFAKQAARFMEHAEIIELHHDKKLDAPSGTALRTAELINENRWYGLYSTPCVGATIIFGEEGDPAGRTRSTSFPSRGLIVNRTPIHSVRMPGLVAHQEVIFGGQGQTLTIRHDSIDRSSFMPGVILAIRKIQELNGVVVGLENLLD